METPIDPWLRLCRLGKDTTVAWINQSFDLWEQQCRALLVGLRPPMSAPMPNPIELWMESWKRWVEAVASARPGSPTAGAKQRAA